MLYLFLYFVWFDVLLFFCYGFIIYFISLTSFKLVWNIFHKKKVAVDHCCYFAVIALKNNSNLN